MRPLTATPDAAPRGIEAQTPPAGLDRTARSPQPETPASVDVLEPFAGSSDEAPSQPSTALAVFEAPALLPHDPEVAAFRGLGFELRMERLRQVAAADPEVARIVDATRRLLLAEPPPPLARELSRRDSPSREVVGAYFEWVAHRGPKEAAQSAAEQAERRALDPALQRTRIDAVVDLIVERLVALGEPVPEAAAQALVALFRGAAARIQTRADTWMLNSYPPELTFEDEDGVRRRPKGSPITDLVETEQALLAGVPIAARDLHLAAAKLASLDGGSPAGFQRPLRPGEWRLTAGGRVEHGQLPAAASTTALACLPRGGSLVVAGRQSALLNVVQQSPAAATAMARIEAHLATLPAGSPEQREAADVYHAYTTTALYDSHRLWQSRGFLDVLCEAAVTAGDASSRAGVLRFLYEGQDVIRDKLRHDFGRQNPGYRDLYVAITHLAGARESWDAAALHFVLGELAWLAEKDPRTLSPRDAEAAWERIVAARRAGPMDTSAASAVLARAPSEPTRLRLGTYRMDVVLRPQAADGEPGKVLEVVERLESTLHDDSEAFETLRRLEALAMRAGYTALQLAGWRNIHEARALRKTGAWRETTQPWMNKNRALRQDPTFIKPLGARLDTAELERFLASPAARGHVRLGNFAMDFRKPFAASLGNAKTLTLSNVDADEPGSGLYPRALAALGVAARRAGFDHVLVADVAEPRHWAFYERLGFARVPGSHDACRAYYVKL